MRGSWPVRDFLWCRMMMPRPLSLSRNPTRCGGCPASGRHKKGRPTNSLPCPVLNQSIDRRWLLSRGAVVVMGGGLGYGCPLAPQKRKPMMMCATLCGWMLRRRHTLMPATTHRLTHRSTDPQPLRSIDVYGGRTLGFAVAWWRGERTKAEDSPRSSPRSVVRCRATASDRRQQARSELHTHRSCETNQRERIESNRSRPLEWIHWIVRCVQSMRALLGVDLATS